MRIVVTRPRPDGERTAAALEALGHEVLVAPLMRIEPVTADLKGQWTAIALTSANALFAFDERVDGIALKKLPVFAVGARSAEAAKLAGFDQVNSANGDVKDLVRLITERCADARPPVLYLAGEERAADLTTDLSARGVAAEMRVVYRAVPMDFPMMLAAALEAGDVDAVMHFSRRSAELFVSGARAAGAAGPALDVRHLCLSPQVAEPLVGASRIDIAARPNEVALIALLRT